MAKVFIKRKKLNEEITINDPTLAQQYLAVKKQITDKQTKRDQLLRNANQIDNEINILQKNLLAIETKAVGQSADKQQQQNQQQNKQSQQNQQTQQPQQNQQNQQQNQNNQNVQESVNDVLSPKEMPTLDEYRELVIQAIDDEYIDGETLAYEYQEFLEKCYNDYDNPKYCAGMIIDKDRGDDDMEEGFIGGDVYNMNQAMKRQPTRVVKEKMDENIEFDTVLPLSDKYEVDNVILIHGEEKTIDDVTKYQNNAIITFSDGTEMTVDELEREGAEIINQRADRDYDFEDENNERSEELADDAKNLENYLDELKQEERMINMEMEETIEEPESSDSIFQPKHPDEIANVFGSRLMKNEEAQEEALKKLNKIYNDDDFPYWANMKYYDESERVSDSEKSYDEVMESEKSWESVEINVDDMSEEDFDLLHKWNSVGRVTIQDNDENTVVNFIPNDTEAMELLSNYTNKDINPYINESVYDDMLNTIDNEMDKLTDIKNYISQYTDEKEKSEIDVQEVPIQIDMEDEDISDEIIDPDEEEYDEENGDLIEVPEYIDMEDEDIPDEIEPERDKFVPSEEERLIDGTLKAETDKRPFDEISEDLEEDDEDVDIEMMNYDIEDEPEDEYVFHIRVDSETEDEIISKIYKDNPADYWTVRVVKGDEEPLQSMKFDPELDKLDIIGYLADMYKEIEIVDPKEYEYLLDDKAKIDSEYYDELDESLDSENINDQIEDMKFDIKATIDTLLEGDDVDFEPISFEEQREIEEEIGFRLEDLANEDMLDTLGAESIKKIYTTLYDMGFI